MKTQKSIYVRVTPETKQRWQAAANRVKYRTLTDFIREACEEKTEREKTLAETLTT